MNVITLLHFQLPLVSFVAVLAWKTIWKMTKLNSVSLSTGKLLRCRNVSWAFLFCCCQWNGRCITRCWACVLSSPLSACLSDLTVVETLAAEPFLKGRSHRKHFSCPMLYFSIVFQSKCAWQMCATIMLASHNFWSAAHMNATFFRCRVKFLSFPQ